ncbi:hypothetical protein COD05_15935 [Bacillus cereus]|nr:hypothetical protein COJ53_03925 [Bacillus cereus]PFQ89089.1 hypothetical protein COK28_18885 [Bacillus cereus]PGP32983.1 hypothetical protein CN989_26640 [Bacillus cereus]PGT07402.1 hypothetical protein COD05_15935 [Bacillus cereus]RFB72472.1 hypothetical protein DZB94_16780 [Bacillus sp. AW]
MNYIATYQYVKIHVKKPEIPKYSSRFLFIYLIVRKIGISCEVVACFYIYLAFFLFIQTEFIVLFSPASKYLIADAFTFTFRCELCSY